MAKEDDFDIQSLVPKDNTPKGPPKVVSLLKGDASGSTSSADDGDDGGELEESEAPRARQTTVAHDVSESERKREREAVRKAREEKEARGDDEDDDDDEPAGEAPTHAAGKMPPKPGAKPKDDDAEPSDAEFIASLKKREREQQWREDARRAAEAEAESIRARAKADADKLLEDARKAARDEVRREIEEGFRTRPGEMLKAWNVPAEKFLRDIADAHTPEGQMRAQVASQQAELERLKRGIEDREKAERDAREASQRQSQETTRAQRERAFVGAITDDAAPTVRLVYDDDAAILKAAYSVISERSAAGKTCTDADIIADLESKAQVRLSALRQRLGASPGAASPAGRANGPRTLSASTTGERRSSPKPVSEMNEDELEAHEREVVRSAREKFQARQEKKAKRKSA